ncbi:MAG: SBBP repeat-containing protein [Bryobacteraceae bacterium]
MRPKCYAMLISAAVTIAAPRVEPLGQIPLFFEPNLGQAHDSVKFTARGGGLAMFLTERETVLAGRGSAIRMKLEGSRMETALEVLDRQPGISNYYRGNDPKRWRVGVPHYAKVVRRGAYEGIDVAYYGNGRRIEYDFVVAPGADPGVIRMAYDGADNVRIDGGDLVLSTRVGEFRQHKPLVYQEVAGRRVELEARYRLRGVEVGFELAGYDRSRPVVIDPELTYGTYLGGAGADIAFAVGVDLSGFVYVGGSTRSPDFPLVKPVDTTQTMREGFISKLSPDGRSLVYSTYFGGDGDDYVRGLSPLLSGDVLVCGHTESRNMPVLNALQAATAGDTSGFVARFSATGSLIYSTYLGGGSGDTAAAIASDNSGNAYVVGYASSPNFPGLAASSGSDGFLVKLSPSGSSRLFTLRIGGSSYDQADAVAVDGTGVYVTGSTGSRDFPTPGGFQKDLAGGFDAFVVKAKLDGSGLLYGTYLGGGGEDHGFGVAVDGAGNAYVTGSTDSRDAPPPTFLAQSGFFLQPRGKDAFVAKIYQSGSLLAYATLLGGSGEDEGRSIAVTADGAAVVTGSTSSADFPEYRALPGDGMIFITRLSGYGYPDYSMRFGSFIAAETPGAVALDSSGTAILAGASDKSVPVKDGFDITYNGGIDVFVVRFADGPPPVRVTIRPSSPGPSITIDGRPYDSAMSFLWQPGSQHYLDAGSIQTVGGTTYAFESWSPGGPYPQVITVPTVDATYVATFSSAACSYSMNPSSLSFNVEGVPIDVSVDTAAGCPWELTSLDAWIFVPYGRRTGPSRFRVAAAVNLDTPRIGQFKLNSVAVTVNQASGGAALPAPAVASPPPEAYKPNYGDSPRAWAAWQPVAGATGYEVLVRGPFPGSPPPDAIHEFRSADQPNWIELDPGFVVSLYIRACAGGFADSQCGPYAFRNVNGEIPPAVSPTILSPNSLQILRTSTWEFRWTPTGTTHYQVILEDTNNKPEMQLLTTGTSFIYSMKGSPNYTLKVRSCAGICIFGTQIVFQTEIPPIPTTAPALTTTSVTGNAYRFTWNPVAGADIYRVAAIQPNSGPGGGALTVASAQTAVPEINLVIPPGRASVIVAACNGRGCGPYSPALQVDAPGPAPAAPIIGQPIPVTSVDGPFVLFTWSRVPGDNGSNTPYRLYVQDLARNAPALDVITANNFYGALFMGEGHRYDAVVVANPGPSQSIGRPAGFIVQGAAPSTPVPVAPTHGGQVRQGNIDIGWSFAGRTGSYQWALFKEGNSSLFLTGIANLTSASVRLAAQGSGSRYTLLVRACADGIDYGCMLGSDLGWGPWSNSAGGGGVTTFTVVP